MTSIAVSADSKSSHHTGSWQLHNFEKSRSSTSYGLIVKKPSFNTTIGSLLSTNIKSKNKMQSFNNKRRVTFISKNQVQFKAFI